MKRAFSIVELIIVIVVIGIFAAILFPVMSNTIDSANAKSALSDDKNTLTNYVAYCESNQKPQRNTCFIAQKAKAHYAFGCFKGVNEHIESKNNPYKADSLQDAVNMLIDTESMVQLGAGSKNITNILPEVPENVLVYEGYSLTPIADQALLSKSRIGLYPTETYTLSTTLLPDRQV